MQAVGVSRGVLLALLVTATTTAFADIQTRCLDVRVSKNVTYNTCEIKETSRLLKDEQEATMYYNIMKKSIDKNIKENWQPPMGFSGYSVNVNYMISPMGTFESIAFDDYYVSDELKQSLIKAIKKSEPVFIPKNDILISRLAQTKIKSTFLIR